MGWGKYFEDDVSIYVGRMNLRSMSVKAPEKPSGNETKPRVYHSKSRLVHSLNQSKAATAQTIDTSNRRGLGLRFTQDVDKNIEKRLRLNHWWHKPGENIWYNNDTKPNREFASRVIETNPAKLIVLNGIK